MKLVNNEYIIEIDDILNNSEIEEVDLTDVFGDNYKLNLAQLSQKTYRAMYSAYRGVYKEKQKKVLRYMINNSDEYKDVIMQSIIEYIRGAIISGLDLNDYVQDEIKRYPESVKEILRQGGLWVVSEITYREEDLV